MLSIRDQIFKPKHKEPRQLRHIQPPNRARNSQWPQLTVGLGYINSLVLKVITSRGRYLHCAIYSRHDQVKGQLPVIPRETFGHGHHVKYKRPGHEHMDHPSVDPIILLMPTFLYHIPSVSQTVTVGVLLELQRGGQSFCYSMFQE